MAMKKATPPRPGATGRTANPTGLGSRKGTKVTKIVKVTKPLTKSVVRNPDAPKSSMPASGLVKPITKSEGFMKRDKARRDRSGIGRPQNSGSYSKVTTVPRGPSTLAGFRVDDSAKKYKADKVGSANQIVKKSAAPKRDANFNQLKTRDSQMRSTQSGTKPSQKITPKKPATPAPKKTTPKSRFFGGRGMRGGGGMGGGGLFGGRGLGQTR
jgi:hypothetical protein